MILFLLLRISLPWHNQFFPVDKFSVLVFFPSHWNLAYLFIKKQTVQLIDSSIKET